MNLAVYRCLIFIFLAGFQPLIFSKNINPEDIEKHLRKINPLLEERNFEKATSEIALMANDLRDEPLVGFFEPFLGAKISMEIKAYSTAFDQFNKAEIAAFKLNRHDLILSVLTNKSELVFRTGNSLLSLQISRQALQKAIELNDSVAIAFAKNDIGGVFFKTSQYKESLLNFKDALSVFGNLAKSKSTMTYWIQNGLDNIALCYDRLGDTVNAEKYYLKAIRECYSTNNIIGASVAQVNLGIMLSRMKQFSRALPLLQSSVKNSETVDYQHFDHASQANFELAKVLVRLNRSEDAEKYLETGYSMMQRRDLEFLQDYFKIRAEIYGLRKDFVSAYRITSKYFGLYDSLKRADAIHSYNKEVLGMDLQRKEVEKTLLIKNLEIESLKNRESRIYFVLLSLILVSLTGIAIYYKRSSLKLRNLNFEIEKGKVAAERANILLQKTGEQKDKILTTVAKDLRGLVEGFLVGTRNLKRMFEQPEEHILGRDLLQQIDSTSSRALQIVQDLADMMELEDRQIILQKKQINLKRIAREAADSLLFEAKPKEIQIDILIEENLVVKADQVRLFRIFQNLISNAIHFSHRGGLVRVYASVLDQKCLISVEDQGIGMDPEIISKIFDPFYTGGNGEKSTGLGLSNVKQIVELHNGKVWVESDPGKGSSFFVELPHL